MNELTPSCVLRNFCVSTIKDTPKVPKTAWDIVFTM